MKKKVLTAIGVVALAILIKAPILHFHAYEDGHKIYFSVYDSISMDISEHQFITPEAIIDSIIE